MKGRNLLSVFGWFGFAVATIYFLAQWQIGRMESSEYIRTALYIAGASVVLIICGYLLQRTKGALGVGMGRCRTCGKKIPKNEVYCYNHGLKQIWDAQDSTRDRLGGKNR